jgi:chemotaxis protein MotB
MPRLTNIIGIGILSIGLTGCVPMEQYAAVKMRAEQLAEQLGHSQTEIAEANAKADAAQRQLAAVNNGTQTNSALAANMQEQNAELQKEADMWHQRYEDSVGKLASANVGQNALPQPLTNALTTFAQQNPDLVEFDPIRGMVKFKSDVTFALGDATVNPKAREVISRFASILNSSGADGYELLVAGHTDNTPVTSEKSLKAGNFNNWYLSAHRAIAVGHELTLDGVNPARMGVVGYADNRPVAANTTAANKQLNRRVEVLILPSTMKAGSSSVASVGTTPVHHRSHKETPASAVPAAAAMSKDSPAPSVTITK